MTMFLIGYDLKRKEDYGSLHEAIMSLSTDWWHGLDSTWIIKHKGSSESILKALEPHLEEGDKLLVVPLFGAGSWFGMGEQERKSWLVANL